MPPAPDQSEYCKICKESYSTWETFLLHKIESPKHISCLFCGRDFNTHEGCRRHQQQFHAAEQNLKCAGCGVEFNRVGSYISHIEQEQCPVIHQSLLEARRAEKEKHNKGKKLTGAIPAWVHAETSVFGDGPLVFEDNGPIETSWDDWGDDAMSAKLESFPALPVQNFKNDGSTVPEIRLGKPDKLSKENLDWLSHKELFPYLPDKPNVYQKPFAAIAVNPVTREEEFHPFDPDNPDFDLRKYYNPITEKWGCPWVDCRKLQNHKQGLIQHLKSPAHMKAKLRCPGCLRQYQSATALVQHAESQAVRCQIRESQEYKLAVDQITGGFVSTAGRHEDNTVRYVAPASFIPGSKRAGFHQQMANASAAYWANQDEKLEQAKRELGDNRGGNW